MHLRSEALDLFHSLSAEAARSASFDGVLQVRKVPEVQAGTGKEQCVCSQAGQVRHRGPMSRSALRKSKDSNLCVCYSCYRNMVTPQVAIIKNDHILQALRAYLPTNSTPKSLCLIYFYGQSWLVNKWKADELNGHQLTLNAKQLKLNGIT